MYLQIIRRTPNNAAKHFIENQEVASYDDDR